MTMCYVNQKCYKYFDENIFIHRAYSPVVNGYLVRLDSILISMLEFDENKMCAVNNNHRKFNSDNLTFVLDQLSKSNVTPSDIEQAVGLCEKLSDILIQLKCPLSNLCSIGGTTQNSNEYFLQNQLKRLRMTSIDLLSCRRNKPKLKVHTARKRRAFETNNANSPEAKRRYIGGENSSLMVEQSEMPIGMDLLDICYICKKHFMTETQRHEFYPWMCFKCGEKNLMKRSQMADLTGKVALVTGGRIKIGFEIALKLLRCGASVIITTRFPNDARRRYELQTDFSEWTTRLHIYGLDLRFIPQVDKFCECLTRSFRRLDIFIQNAAQTIRRPTVYYKTLIDGERAHSSIGSNENCITSNRFDGQSVMELRSNDTLSCSTETSQLLIHPEDFKYASNSQLSQLHFPLNGKDVDGDQLDLRPKNTWTTALHEVETEEMLEVTLANYMSPFILLKKLTPLMTAGRTSK